jgi:hypothetical protein
MAPLKPLPKVSELPQPALLDRYFPPENQQHYVSLLMGRGGLTRRRAECFVRLWAYLVLKQRQAAGQTPSLTQLYLPEGSISCTHREAAELFYGQQERGSDRAAGMMIDRLSALGLLEKRFDGQTLCLQLRALPELLVTPTRATAPTKFMAAEFNPRTDAIPAANLIARAYAEIIQSNRQLKDPLMASHKIARVLRQWAQQYPHGMRILRRCDNLNPIAISVFYPTARESEVNFFQPPSKSFYLTADTEIDPFKAAQIGTPECTAVYIRAWTIDAAYVGRDAIELMLEDTKQTLQRMRLDFPNLCDIYSAFVQPMYEELRFALGFQKISQDAQRSYSWIYLALDHFLEQDIQKVLVTLKIDADRRE